VVGWVGLGRLDSEAAVVSLHMQSKFHSRSTRPSIHHHQAGETTTHRSIPHSSSVHTDGSRWVTASVAPAPCASCTSVRPLSRSCTDDTGIDSSARARPISNTGQALCATGLLESPFCPVASVLPMITNVVGRLPGTAVTGSPPCGGQLIVALGVMSTPLPWTSIRTRGRTGGRRACVVGRGVG